MLQNKYFILLVSMFLFYTFPSYSDETKRLFIEITNPHIKKLPLAIMELSNLGIQTDQELLKEIRETLEFDLDVSGIFKLIPPKAFLTQKINITNFSPEIVVPIGKLSLSYCLNREVNLLEDFIGKSYLVNPYQALNKKLIVIPLPHPSGASTWRHKKENKKLLKLALAKLKQELYRK